MGKRKQTKDKEFISTEKALDMIEPFDEYAHYDEDSEEKEDIPATFEGSEEDTLVSLILNAPAVQGSVATPSEATKNKFYSQGRERFSKKEDGLHVLGVFFPLTVGEDTLKDALYDVTDYHEAMMNNILEQKYSKEQSEENIFTFRNQPISQKRRHVQAFQYTQQLRDFYKIDEEDDYDRRELKAIILKNKKPLPVKLAAKVFALEEVYKQWFQGYLPYRTYEAIKQQAEQSLYLADKRYKEDTGKDPIPIRKRLLEQTIEDLKKGKF